MIEYREATIDDYEAVRGLLADNGWQSRVRDEQRFRSMMDNASRAVIAVHDGKVVGFARALCDDASNGYIGTVAVAEKMRGRGIGRALVEQLMGYNPNITWVLRAGRSDSVGFWEKMGFRRSEVAMERTRQSSS